MKIPKSSLRFIFFFVILAFTVAIRLEAGQYEDSIVASVNGEPITLFDIVSETVRSEFRKTAYLSGNELREEVLKKRKDALDEIINRKLLYIEFKAREYKIPQQYLESIFDDICADIAGGDKKKLEKMLADSGSSIEKFKERIYEKAAADLLVNEFCRKPVNITPREIFEYYEANKSEFSSPPKTELQIIFLDKKGRHKDNLEALSREIENDCKNADENIFSTLASLYSDAPGAKEGGKSGWIETKNIREEFKNALGDIKTGAIAGPITTDEGIYFIRISGMTGESIIPFESVESDIKNKLSEKDFKRRYDELISKLRERSVLKYY